MITKEEFFIFDELKKLNLKDISISYIKEHTGLSKDKIIEILKDYDYYKEIYSLDNISILKHKNKINKEVD